MVDNRNPESIIKRKICDYLAIQPHLVYWMNETIAVKGRSRHSKYQRNGVSDILGHWYGKFFAIEVKAPGYSKTSETYLRQLEFVREINISGGFAMITDSLDKLDEAMWDYAEENRLNLNRLKFFTTTI